jgi:hypothetical protein
MLTNARTKFIEYKRSHNVIGDAIPLEIVLDFLEKYCEGRLPKLLTIPEAAQLLRMSRVQAWRYCKEGSWPTVQIAKSRRILIDTKQFLEIYPALKPAELKA